MVAGVGAQVDDPIGGGDHVQVVFDHDERGTAVDQTVEQCDEAGGVGDVQAGGRFVENNGVSGRSEVGGEFETLAFTAGQAGERLAECQIPRPTSRRPISTRTMGRVEPVQRVVDLIS